MAALALPPSFARTRPSSRSSAAALALLLAAIICHDRRDLFGEA